jgi:hypothetical protein
MERKEGGKVKQERRSREEKEENINRTGKRKFGGHRSGED